MFDESYYNIRACICNRLWFHILVVILLMILFLERLQANMVFHIDWNFRYTDQKSLLRAVSVSTKTILISGCVGGPVGVSHTPKLGTFFFEVLRYRIAYVESRT